MKELSSDPVTAEGRDQSDDRSWDRVRRHYKVVVLGGPPVGRELILASTDPFQLVGPDHSGRRPGVDSCRRGVHRPEGLGGFGPR
jgi:hypothetical protein